MIFGWRVHSQRPFPLLPRWDRPGTGTPITVTYGALPSDGETPACSNDIADLYTNGRVLFRPAGGPRMLVENGPRIVMEPGDYPDAELHTWLFNTAITPVCHHLGRPPLHGAVIEIGGRAVVLAGNSGHGKSTTTWAMLQRGHRLMSDDLAVIDPDTMMVEPAFPSVKLWKGAVPAQSIDYRLRSLPHKEKFFIPVPDRFQAAPQPLGLVIALEKDAGLSRPAIQRIPPLIAAAQLQRHVLGRLLGVTLDGARTAFNLTVAIARAVPFFVLRRPDDIAGLDDICTTIETLAETVRREAGS